MARPKEALALVVDVSEPMGAASLLERARDLAQGFMSNMLREGKKNDEVCVLASGADSTDNPEFTEYGGCEHVVVVRPLEECSAETLLSVDQEDVFKKSSTQTQADLGDAVRVARQMIIKRTAKKKYNRRIIVLTSTRSAGLETLRSAVDEIKAHPEIKITLVAVDASPSGNVDDESDLQSFAQSIPDQLCAFRSAKQVEERLLREHVGSKGQVAAYRGVLRVLNDAVGFHVQAFTKTRRESPPSLKKVSKVVVDKDETAANDVNLAQVSRQISYTLPDNPDAEVAVDDIAEGYRYGREVVPLSGHDAEIATYATIKELTVLGYLDRSKVPLWMNMGSVNFIEAMPGLERSNQGFRAWVQALLELNRVAVARFVPRDKGTLSIVALVPYKDEAHGYECLFSRELPFEQDTRDFSFGTIKLQSLTPSTEQKAAVDALVTAMDLSAGIKVEDQASSASTPAQVRKELFRPEDTLNPFLERLFRLLLERAKAPGSALPQDDPVVTSFYKPNETMLEAAKPALEQIRSLFKLEHVVDPKTGRKADGEPAAKRARIGAAGESKENDGEPQATGIGVVQEADADASASGWFDADKRIDAVGNVNPEGDYNAMLDRRDKDLSEPAFHGMVKQIDLLLGPEGGEEFHPKALRCVEALRKGSLRASTETDFNHFLRRLKVSCEPSFWKRVAAANLTLISSDDAVAVSGVSAKDAADFIKENVSRNDQAGALMAPAPAVPAQDADFDDFD
ncbi:ATP-dependent DNA helicase II subunit 2 [Hondaea fermentalgiana]|uniref:ATP-dependent DNA helicase II subunit 2 n=1 Tax=Hondaea fermentalgiana TaxID=2315210 RepID=A0A2R5GAH5_9STRA|nr:ATP-dependent DNA helicase II subunit 2 [Hondaea fermentalgiana]|eukprot:GBG27299.1 ATP-dependent DNA helicase II subunit 2 [Hondaea fermentalgiana]